MESGWNLCSQCQFPLPRNIPFHLPPSPVPDLLYTNSVPSPPQSYSIRHAISSVLSSITQLDSQIALVSRMLIDLQTERAGLQTYIDEHQALLTPARRLFPEILSEIFQRCSRGSVRKRLPEVLDTFHPKQGPLLLTQICRSWRDVAISTPDLWTLIRVVVRHPMESQAKLVETWLKRSASMPLTVGIMEVKPHPYCTEGYPGTHDWSENKAIHALVAESRRWEEVHFMLPPHIVSWEVFGRVKGQLPLLKRLAVNVSRGSFPLYLQDHNQNTIDIFSDAPQLTHLTLDYGTPISILHLPRTQLTHLTICMHRETPTSVNFCLYALHALPNISHCTLHVGCVDPWVRLRPVHNTQLRVLKVVVEPLREDTLDKSVKALFDNLTLPQLRGLHVVNDAKRPWDHGSFVNFLSRSPLVEGLKLNIKETVTNQRQLADIVLETPNLSALSLTAHTENLPLMLSSLSPANSPGHSAESRLPKLKMLELDFFGGGSNLEPTPLRSLVDIVKSRTMNAELNRVCRLEGVCLSFGTVSDDEIRDVLDEVGRYVDGKSVGQRD